MRFSGISISVRPLPGENKIHGVVDVLPSDNPNIASDEVQLNGLTIAKGRDYRYMDTLINCAEKLRTGDPTAVPEIKKLLGLALQLFMIANQSELGRDLPEQAKGIAQQLLPSVMTTDSTRPTGFLSQWFADDPDDPHAEERWTYDSKRNTLSWEDTVDQN